MPLLLTIKGYCRHANPLLQERRKVKTDPLWKGHFSLCVESRTRHFSGGRGTPRHPGVWISWKSRGCFEINPFSCPFVPMYVPPNLHLGNSRACFLCFPSNFSISLSFRPTKQCQTSHNPINQRSVRNRSFEIPSPPSGFRGFPCWLILTNPEVHRQSEINLCYIQ